MYNVVLRHIPSIPLRTTAYMSKVYAMLDKSLIHKVMCIIPFLYCLWILISSSLDFNNI